MPKRSAYACAIVLAAILVATMASSPWASDDTPQSSPAATLIPDGDAKQALESLLRRSGTVLNASNDPVLDFLLGEARSPAKVKPFIYSSAVDGDLFVYARTSRTLTRKQMAESLGAFPSIVVRKNLRTGVEDVLLRSNSTAVGSIVVKGGAISIGTTKVSAGRRSVVFETSVLHAAPGAAELQVLASNSGRVTIGRSGVRVCGTLGGLVGASDAGHPLLTTLSGKCDELGFLSSQTRELLGLDSSVPLELPSEMILFDDAGSEIVGDRALIGDRFSSALGIADIRTGAFTALWQDGATATALADDGTVAVMQEPNEEFYEDFSHETAPTTPLVIFPQGNADNPVESQMARDSAVSTFFKFCGPNFYVIKQLAPTAKQRRTIDVDDVYTVDRDQREIANYRVLAYDRAGALVKDLGKTPGMRLADYGCSAGTLVMIASRGVKTTELRFQP